MAAGSIEAAHTSHVMPHRAKLIIGIISVVLTLTTAPACNEEPTLRTVGECNEVAKGQGCLQIQATQGFNGYVRVLALEEKIGGNLLGSFFELPGNQSIESGMTAGHYRVEGFTDSQRPKVDAEPDCSRTVEVTVGVGIATTVEPDDKDGCEVGRPDGERVQKLVGGIEGKRVTWKELTGKQQPAPKPEPRKVSRYPMGPF